MADTTLRQRKLPLEVEQPEEADITATKTKKTTTSSKFDDEIDDYTPWVDVLRVLTFLFIASCGLSYVISGGEAWFWGMKNKPVYMKVDYWKEKINGPPPATYMSLAELAVYDGSDPEKPVYLAINGTIYDVSNGRHIYGPEGSYHWFAGCDAARSYVTGCFSEDRTADMRGVETMFLPIDDPEMDAHWSAADFEKLRAKELETAKQRTHDALKHWVDFFANSAKYSKVGYVLREEDWLEKETPRELCAPAQAGRSKRRIPRDDD
ncbi:hypothetical protein G7046_g4950 [Stylonectria norvegica]|nr:hypothetical protein G7046_g4950 [Stylonectria norvegica]